MGSLRATAGNQRYSLKREFYPEVMLDWPYYQAYDKTNVKRIIILFPDGLLQEVGSLRATAGNRRYSLKREFYPEVMLDWPYYQAYDKTNVKRIIILFPDGLLQEVGSLRATAGNQRYSLKREFYPEVMLDWPYYQAYDKTNVKRIIILFPDGLLQEVGSLRATAGNRRYSLKREFYPEVMLDWPYYQAYDKTNVKRIIILFPDGLLQEVGSLRATAGNRRYSLKREFYPEVMLDWPYYQAYDKTNVKRIIILFPDGLLQEVGSLRATAGNQRYSLKREFYPEVMLDWPYYQAYDKTNVKRIIILFPDGLLQEVGSLRATAGNQRYSLKREFYPEVMLDWPYYLAYDKTNVKRIIILFPDGLLQEVGSLRATAGNQRYSLKREFYPEVMLDWPYYQAYDKTNVKRILEGASGSSSNVDRAQPPADHAGGLASRKRGGSLKPPSATPKQPSSSASSMGAPAKKIKTELQPSAVLDALSSDVLAMPGDRKSSADPTTDAKSAAKSASSSSSKKSGLGTASQSTTAPVLSRTEHLSSGSVDGLESLLFGDSTPPHKIKSSPHNSPRNPSAAAEATANSTLAADNAKSSKDNQHAQKSTTSKKDGNHHPKSSKPAAKPTPTEAAVPLKPPKPTEKKKHHHHKSPDGKGENNVSTTQKSKSKPTKDPNAHAQSTTDTAGKRNSPLSPGGSTHHSSVPAVPPEPLNSDNDAGTPPKYLSACNVSAKDRRKIEADFPTPITTADQRNRYHLSFKQDYDEYTKCYNLLKDVAKRFDSFERALEQDPEGSPGYAAVEADIQKAYEELCGDESFLHARKRHAYLRHKLQHIKLAVNSWDTKAKA